MPDINKGDDWVIAKNYEEAMEKAVKKFGKSKDELILH